MIQIYDNFLDEENFNFIQCHMMGGEFPWNLGVVSVRGRDEFVCDELDNVQFFKWIYKDNQSNGPEIKIVE